MQELKPLIDDIFANYASDYIFKDIVISLSINKSKAIYKMTSSLIVTGKEYKYFAALSICTKEGKELESKLLNSKSFDKLKERINTLLSGFGYVFNAEENEIRFIKT